MTPHAYPPPPRPPRAPIRVDRTTVCAPGMAGAGFWEEVMDFNGTNEQLLNCLEVIANQKSCPQRTATIILEAADRLQRAADRLAQIEAALAAANPEAIALAILNSDRAMAGLPPIDSRANCPDSDGYVINATAALAALRELIGGV